MRCAKPGSKPTFTASNSAWAGNCYLPSHAPMAQTAGLSIIASTSERRLHLLELALQRGALLAVTRGRH